MYKNCEIKYERYSKRAQNPFVANNSGKNTCELYENQVGTVLKRIFCKEK